MDMYKHTIPHFYPPPHFVRPTGLWFYKIFIHHILRRVVHWLHNHGSCIVGNGYFNQWQRLLLPLRLPS